MSDGGAIVVAGIVGGGSAILSAGLAAYGTYKLTGRTANEDRRQERIRDAYVTIQLHINGWGNYATWAANPAMMVVQVRPRPPDLSDEAEAVAALVASDQIVTATTEFNKRLQSILSALAISDEAQRLMTTAPHTVISLQDAYLEVIRIAGEVTDAAEGVHLQMRRELAGK